MNDYALRNASENLTDALHQYAQAVRAHNYTHKEDGLGSCRGVGGCGLQRHRHDMERDFLERVTAYATSDEYTVKITIEKEEQ